MKALLVNKIGDIGLLLGLLSLYVSMFTLDTHALACVFLYPYGGINARHGGKELMFHSVTQEQWSSEGCTPLVTCVYSYGIGNPIEFTSAACVSLGVQGT